MSNRTHIIIEIVMGVVILLLSIFLFRSCHQEEIEPTIVTKTDTIVELKIDTVFIEKPKIIEQKVIDTLYIKSDTTLFFESRTFADSVSTIWVSGINPLVDSVEYHIPKEYITIEKETTITKIKQKHWGQQIGINLQVGYGVTINQTPTFTPYVGVGISYGFGYTF